MAFRHTVHASQAGAVQYYDAHGYPVRQVYQVHSSVQQAPKSVVMQPAIFRVMGQQSARAQVAATPQVVATKQGLISTLGPRRLAPTATGAATPMPRERDVLSQTRDVLSQTRDVLSQTCRPADMSAPLGMRNRRCTAPSQHLQLPQQLQTSAQQSPRPHVLNQLDITAPAVPLSEMTKAQASRRRLSCGNMPLSGSENVPPTFNQNELPVKGKSGKEAARRHSQQEPMMPRPAWQENLLQRPGWQEATPLRRSPMRQRGIMEPVLQISPQAKPLAESRIRARVNVVPPEQGQMPRSPPVERRPEPPMNTGSSRTPVAIPSAWRDTFDLGSEGCPIGCGAFADVFRVVNKRTRRCCAIKVMHRPNFAMRGIERQLDAEIEAMRASADFEDGITEQGEGHHIVRLLNYIEENEFVFLLLDFCQEGDLLRRLQLEPCARCSEHQTAVWARQLFLGLRTVHFLGFLHRDIKPDNLLLASGSQLKIADFGWCCYATDRPTSLAGTFLYMAPEVLQNKPQDAQLDVWSAGVTLFQVLFGRQLLVADLTTGISEVDPHAATAKKQARLVQEIYETCPPRVELRPKEISVQCWDFLRRTLEPEPLDRITVDQALEHPWLRSVV